MVEIDKKLLKLMMTEYWSVDNNPLCTAATVSFLRKIGFDEYDIRDIIYEDYDESDVIDLEDEFK